MTGLLIEKYIRLVTSEHGENYWFNGCAAYVMECLGEKDYDYQFFAGITGDVFVQHYRQPFMGDGINAYHQVGGDLGFFVRLSPNAATLRILFRSAACFRTKRNLCKCCGLILKKASLSYPLGCLDPHAAFS